MTSNAWLPGETAPKDGSWFLVLVPDSPMAWAPYEFASWTSDFTGEFYFCQTDTSDRIDFDWWQPLPPANPAPARPLPSITDEEAKEALRYAYKHCSNDKDIYVKRNTPTDNAITIIDKENVLGITDDGQLFTWAQREYGINAPKLVDYLRSIRIAFESVT